MIEDRIEDENNSDSLNHSSDDDTEIVDAPVGEVVKYVSKEKIEKFEKKFPDLVGQDLLLTKRCTLEKDGLPRGNLMITRTHFCFFSSHSKKNKVVISVKDVVKMKKGGGILPNSIKVEAVDGTKAIFGIMSKRDAVFNLMKIIAVGVKGSFKEDSTSSDDKEEPEKVEERKESMDSLAITNIKNERRKSSSEKKPDETVTGFFKKLSIDIQSKKSLTNGQQSPIDKSQSKIFKKKKRDSSSELAPHLYQKMVINQVLPIGPEKLDEIMFHSSFKFQFTESVSSWELVEGRGQRNLTLFIPFNISFLKGVDKRYLGRWIGTEVYTIKEKGHYVVQVDIHPESGEVVHISCTITITSHDSDQKESRLTAQLHVNFQDKGLESFVSVADELCNEFTEKIKQSLSEKVDKDADSKVGTGSKGETVGSPLPTPTTPNKPVESKSSSSPSSPTTSSSSDVPKATLINPIDFIKMHALKIGSLIFILLFIIFVYWLVFGPSQQELEWETFVSVAKENPRVHLDEIIVLQKQLQERVVSHNEVSKILQRFQSVEEQLEKLAKA